MMIGFHRRLPYEDACKHSLVKRGREQISVVYRSAAEPANIERETASSGNASVTYRLHSSIRRTGQRKYMSKSITN